MKRSFIERFFECVAPNLVTTGCLLFMKERVMSPQESAGLPYWLIALCLVFGSVSMFISIEVDSRFRRWRKHKQLSGRYQALASSVDQQVFIQNEISVLKDAEDAADLLDSFGKMGITLTDEQQTQLREKELEAATAHPPETEVASAPAKD